MCGCGDVDVEKRGVGRDVGVGDVSCEDRVLFAAVCANMWQPANIYGVGMGRTWGKNRDRVRNPDSGTGLWIRILGPDSGIGFLGPDSGTGF